LLAGQALFVTPIQWLSQSGTTGTTRSYPDASKTNLRVFYSNANDGSVLAGPASISDVNVSTTGTSESLVHVDVTVNGTPVNDVFDVLVSYTGTNPKSPFYGHWQTCSLIGNRKDTDTTSGSCSSNVTVLPIQTQPFSFVRHYIGDIDAGTAANANDLRLMVQVVTNTGLVSTRNNNGQYFSAETATIVNPKADSTVTLVDPITNPVTYDRPVTFTANITSDKSTCTGGRLVSFHLGSQTKTVAADANGKATATFNVLAIPTSIDGRTPANYPLNVTVDETADCLAGFATAAKQVSVQKKNTSLAFVNGNPYLAKLVDADNVALRDAFVFFTLTKAGGAAATRSAQTDGNGIAQLRDLQLPAGDYTVTVSFPGTIPTKGGTINLTDERYNPAPPINTRLTADATAPNCTIVGIFTNSAGQKYVKITVQDTGSGLAAVNPTEQVNLLPLQISDYSAGIKTVVTVIATKRDQSQSSQIALEVDDVAGNVTSCDPILTQVGRDGPGGVPRTDSFNHVAHGESFVTIVNGTPG
ncbi:MAG: hypothetical protein J2P17_34405, partial [Mycobacterium sp.]|nr:hypothetical protein [Mycobacterium sp.]